MQCKYLSQNSIQSCHVMLTCSKSSYFYIKISLHSKKIPKFGNTNKILITVTVIHHFSFHLFSTIFQVFTVYSIRMTPQPENLGKIHLWYDNIYNAIFNNNIQNGNVCPAVLKFIFFINSNLVLIVNYLGNLRVMIPSSWCLHLLKTILFIHFEDFYY